jgi:hypothetical protein
MPQLTFPVTRAGLAVPVWLGLTNPAMRSAVAAGQPIPTPVGAAGLLDTACDLTAVAPWILRQLAVPLSKTATTHTACGQVPVNLYRVSLGITDPTQPPALPG